VSVAPLLLEPLPVTKYVFILLLRLRIDAVVFCVNWGTLAVLSEVINNQSIRLRKTILEIIKIPKFRKITRNRIFPEFRSFPRIPILIVAPPCQDGHGA
jgi:hypothetical protein